MDTKEATQSHAPIIVQMAYPTSLLGKAAQIMPAVLRLSSAVVTVAGVLSARPHQLHRPRGRLVREGLVS